MSLETVTAMANPQSASTPVLELSDAIKRFGKNVALNEVNFDLLPGEVHGLVGENGAGKSTLVKILAGVHADYEGEMRLNGHQVRFHAPAEAKAQGIAMIYQELSVIKPLSVAENIFLGSQPVGRLGTVQWRYMQEEAAAHLQELGLEHITVTRPIGDFPVGIQQMVEIARVLFSGARIIIMDEPTSALSPPEAAHLFAFIERLKARGTSIIYISHFLEDVLQVSGRVTVLKNGFHAGTWATTEASKEDLIRAMIGAGAYMVLEGYEGEAIHQTADQQKEAVLRVENLTRRRGFQSITFELHAGEILGIYGFMGAGKTELATCLFGMHPPSGGQIYLNGTPTEITSTTMAKKLGIAYVPDSRRMSIFPGKELYKNVTLSYLDQIFQVVLRRAREISVTEAQIRKTGVVPANPLMDIAHLSGGNQQKAILARWLVRRPKVLILNEPTRGMDVGAKNEVLNLIQNLHRENVAIILISSEPEIVLGNCDRILVMSKGRITQTLINEGLTKEVLMSYV